MWRGAVTRRLGLTAALLLAAGCGRSRGAQVDAAAGAGGAAAGVAGGQAGAGAGGGGGGGKGGRAGSAGGAQTDGGVTAATLGLTPCRDLSPPAVSIVAAAGGGYFLATNPLGASLISNGTWQIPRTFTGQLGHMSAGAIAPDASWGATIGDDDTLRIWRASDGKEIGHVVLGAAPGAVAASPVGNLAVVGDSAGTVMGVDPATGMPLWKATTIGGAVQSILFTPDGQTLVVGTPKDFEWRSAVSGDLVRTYPTPAGDGGLSSDAGVGATFAPAAALSPDGTRLAVSTGDASGGTAVKVIATTDGSQIGPVLNGQHQVSALAFSADGTQLVVGSLAGAVLYDVATDMAVRTFETSVPPDDLTLSPDGTILAVAALDLHFYQFSDGTEVNTSGQTGFIWSGMFARDGVREVFGGVAGPTQIWDAAQGLRLRVIPRSSALGNQGSVIFSPTDQLLVAFNATGTTWDVTQGTIASTVTFAGLISYDSISNAVFTPDGKKIIGVNLSGNYGAVTLWDASSGAILRTWTAHGTDVNALALSPDGTVLATAGFEQPPPDGGIVPVGIDIKLWDVASGALLVTMVGHTDIINSVAFSPDGKLLLAGDRHGLVRLWSVPGGQTVRDLATGPIPVVGAELDTFGNSVAFSPDGKTVAAAGVDWTITSGHTGVIALWSTATGAVVGRLLSLADANLGYIAWSPSGNLLTAGSADGMRVWCLDELATR